MDEIFISDDKSLLDIKLIHSFLSKSYWAEGRSIEEVKRSIEHSVCFGVYKDQKQIGFARIVSDQTVFAYLMDIFIIEEFRGRGYSRLPMNRILNDQRFKLVKKWMLATKDAHFMYEKFGFKLVNKPERLMEKLTRVNN